MIEEQSSYFHAKKKISLKRAYKPDLLVEDLVKRRKSEMEDDQCAAMENQHRENLGRAYCNEVDAIACNVLSRREERTVKNNNASFSISRALAGFISLNCKRANLNKCKDASRETVEKDQKPSSIEQTKYEDMSYDSYHISIPCPDIPASSSLECFILSSTIFEQRRLVRHIREYLPHAQLIERVFNFGLDSSKEQDKKKRSNIAGEADILISPTTGLILTTLQRIKQRALPGQTRTSPMKERLKVLAEKYEEIILLVSKTDISDVDVENLCLLDGSDCEALADIQGFAAQLKCNLKVNYVLCEREELINWTIAIMRKYSVENEISKNVLEDESLVIFHAVLIYRILCNLLIWKLNT